MPYANREDRIASQKRYFERVKLDPVRKAHMREQNNRLRKRLLSNDPRKSLMYSARERARKFNVPINIEFGDIFVPEICPILGIKIARAIGGVSDNSPSLDRIVPSKGYVKGNIIVISHKANRLKSNASIKELEKVLDFLRKHYP